MAYTGESKPKMTQQQMMEQGIAEQDEQLAILAHSLTVTSQMANMMNGELSAQNKIIENLQSHVDDTDLRIRAATQQTKTLIKITKDNKSLCCMLLLIIALFCTLVLLIVYL